MICSLSHYTFDLCGGGGVRAFNVWKIFEKIYNDVVVSYALSADSKQIKFEGIVENHIEKPLLLRKVSGGYLCAFPALIKPQLSKANIFKNVPAIVMLEHPYMGYAVLKSIGIPRSSIVIYDAHNVEVTYNRHSFHMNPLKKVFLHKIRLMEKKVIEECQYILSTSDEDSKTLQDVYGIRNEKIILLPNGVDTEAIKPLDEEMRFSLKAESSIKSPLVIFMGSSVEANIVAGKWVVEFLAKRMPEITFAIIGDVCRELHSTQKNVRLLGRLSATDKNRMLQLADLAVNPVLFGAGTNIKMLEYLSAGLPIVSTLVGVRGLNLMDREEVIISDLNNFPKYINEIIHDESLQGVLRKNSRQKAFDYQWKNIGLSVGSRLIHSTHGK